ncbi:MAG TPA: hypothetical protein VMU56_08470, partial [Beijerinckiaceae bacterium]|nr:hypothetical protein [Beijerinckiaceae bacterium]
AVTIPGLITYTLAHAVRGYATEGVSDPWTLGWSKFAASCIAGGLAGMVTNVICQMNSDKFDAADPVETVSENIKKQMMALCENLTARRVGREFAGRILGSMAGMFAAVPIAPFDLPGATTLAGQGATQGALGKFIYQSGFYLGAHLGAATGNFVDRIRARPRSGSESDSD